MIIHFLRPLFKTRKIQLEGTLESKQNKGLVAHKMAQATPVSVT